MIQSDETNSESGSKSKTPKSHSGHEGNESTHKSENNSQSKTVYQCPMKCEGEKTYPDSGICPICNMHLAPVGEENLPH